MTGRGERALVLGCHGGVGRSLLALLEHSVPGRTLRDGLEELLLVDRVLPDERIPRPAGTLLPPAEVNAPGDLARLVRQHAVTQVIDVSSIDTVDCTQVCDELGADFLCTSVEEWSRRGSMPTDEAIARLLPPRRPSLTRQSHLVGSGANPGIVNALVFTALDEFANRVGVSATVEALELSAILITEEDTTIEEGFDAGDVFPMTWSPFHCLEELFEPAAFVARRGAVAPLGHQPTARWYQARCGEEIIEAMAVPHEEVVTLARRVAVDEIGFLYRIPPMAREALAAHPERKSPGLWRTYRLWPPWAGSLIGEDRVGVLLCSRRFGELWMGFQTNVAMGLALGTNATQLQVAAGILAGWQQLGARKGIHFVEDLDARQFVRTASEVLGPPLVVHDPSALPAMLRDREVALPEVRK